MPTSPPFHCDHLKLGVRLGDLDAVEVVLEAAVTAALNDRAIAARCRERRERRMELAARREVIAKLGDDRAAVVAVGEPVEPERERGLDPLRGVGATERVLDQLVGGLETVQGLAPDLEDHGVARAREREVLRRRLDRRPERQRDEVDRLRGRSSSSTSSPSAHVSPGMTST